MNIAVVVRQVPDLIEPLEIDSSGAASTWAPPRSSSTSRTTTPWSRPSCIKEAGGATVSVVALDFGDVDNTLYTAAAKGADRIVKMPLDGVPPPPRAAAAVYAGPSSRSSPTGAGRRAGPRRVGRRALAVPGRGPGPALRRRDPGRQGRARAGHVTACKEFPGAVMARLKSSCRPCWASGASNRPATCR